MCVAKCVVSRFVRLFMHNVYVHNTQSYLTTQTHNPADKNMSEECFGNVPIKL